MSTKQIVFSVLGLLALCALVWFVGPLIAIGGKEWLADDMTRLIVILVIVLLWMANLLRKALSEKSADKQLAEGLTKAEPAAKGKSAAPADGRAMEQELKLRERFQEAVEVLRKSGGKKNGSLYDLPWYVIIGPPGAGKTTALKNSGLKFPLADRFG
ncbi:MAG: type VI secretion system membrane subunit TssM, partial [Gammaproteobacteria bacterium]